MSTETDKPKPPAPLPVGGVVTAIVPQTFEEIQRVANTVIAAGIAPQSLVKTPKDNENPQDVARRNIAAVASAIMAGAELGLPPMVALRSFTVINGRPALYADGNVAVVRKAKGTDGAHICEYIRSGYQQGETDETTFAWCEAKRADTGEVYREEFSVFDAKRARLWDDRETIRKKGWGAKPDYDAPNDAPWHRFPKRMMMWRATGYCLRWLFADVLGGMPDEYEARDMEQMIDITPSSASYSAGPPSAPLIEDEPEPQVSVFDPEAFIGHIDTTLAAAADDEAVEMAFDELDVQNVLAGLDDWLEKAFKVKADHLERVGRKEDDA